MQKEAAVSGLEAANADKLQACIEVRTAPFAAEVLVHIYGFCLIQEYKQQNIMPCREMLYQGRNKMQTTRLRS